MKTLITLIFSATNPQNQYVEFIYSNSDFGHCLDQLTLLASCGWHLISIKCLYGQGPSFSLPVEAFDDQLISVVLSQLQQEWETLLQV